MLNSINGMTFRTCVDSCPVGTYLVPKISECVPCNEHCDANAGCGGSLPYLDRENGCKDCALVQLRRLGQVISKKYSSHGSKRRGTPHARKFPYLDSN